MFRHKAAQGLHFDDDPVLDDQVRVYLRRPVAASFVIPANLMRRMQYAHHRTIAADISIPLIHGRAMGLSIGRTTGHPSADAAIRQTFTPSTTSRPHASALPRAVQRPHAHR